MNTEPRGRASVLVLAGDAEEAVDVADALIGFDASSATVGDAAPPRPGDEDLAAADVAVVLDAAGLDAVRERDRFCRVVALIDDPASPVATDPLVDAIATAPADLDATLRWLASRAEPGLDRDDPARTPSRIEQLNAEVTRLASVRSVEAAHRTAIAVADEVFPRYHCVVGVRDGEWVEPIATSSDVSVGDCDRVRVGRGSVGTAVETGEPVVESRAAEAVPYRTLLSLPVGDDTVLQLATDEEGFDADDRRLAELLASHVEETLDRIRTDEALRTERDHLLALFSNVPDPAIAYDYVDGEPIVHRVNDAFEETFGYDAERVVGESVDDFIVPPTDDAESEATELNERLQRGENVRREVTRETADGPRHFILHVVPIRLDAENVSGYAIYTDVTDRREREAALERQNERLDEFASIVSHDLRNPLSVAEGYVDLAAETGEPDHLETAAEALDRMDELVGDLLSLARQGESVGETSSVSIEAIARDAWGSVDTGDVELVVDGDVTIDANATRTRELLENVFRNSVEHGRSRDGGASDGPLTVRVGKAAFRGGDGESGNGFFVEDDGRGLPEGERDRVFESGFTTEENGTGLGLAITERIADAHGWEVRALAGDSGGARFEFKTS
ncbi:ATP-binding protein [Halorubrum sp. CSM-61]|uniref:ATP-binding protein n=1 Tax=Halorubrum sp. CSM-61 TaxID=2485838 RepID=UPI001F149E24|nr:ATP-binding protein [Halorubrum sp. CSM-61]